MNKLNPKQIEKQIAADEYELAKLVEDAAKIKAAVQQQAQEAHQKLIEAAERAQQLKGSIATLKGLIASPPPVSTPPPVAARKRSRK